MRGRARDRRKPDRGRGDHHRSVCPASGDWCSSECGDLLDAAAQCARQPGRRRSWPSRGHQERDRSRRVTDLVDGRTGPADEVDPALLVSATVSDGVRAVALGFVIVISSRARADRHRRGNRPVKPSLSYGILWMMSIELTPTSYLVLGLLEEGPSTPYELKPARRRDRALLVVPHALLYSELPARSLAS
jgi:hypothetical protein